MITHLSIIISMRDVNVLQEDYLSPRGSCCDNGRYVFKDCGNWWYNCEDYGLQNFTWIRFGSDAFTLPLGTEHQAKCSYNKTSTICPLPASCDRRIPRTVKEICPEYPIVEFVS